MIFVTGGSGLVGSFLLAALVARGLPVRALYRQQIPRIPAAGAVQWVQGDIRDALSLRDMLEDVTHVFHCAGLVDLLGTDAHNLKHLENIRTKVLMSSYLPKALALPLLNNSL